MKISMNDCHLSCFISGALTSFSSVEEGKIVLEDLIDLRPSSQIYKFEIFIWRSGHTQHLLNIYFWK